MESGLMKRILSLLISEIILVGCDSQSNTSPPGSSGFKYGYYFEKIDTSSPEKLFSVLKMAFERYDYLTIWLCLDYRVQSQFDILTQIELTKDFFSNRVNMSSIPKMTPAAKLIFNDIPMYRMQGTLEKVASTSRQDPGSNLFYQFITLQIAARKHNVQIYTLKPGVKITKIKTKSKSLKILMLSDGYAATIVRHISGRWKLHNIHKQNDPLYSFPIRNWQKNSKMYNEALK